LNRLTVNDDETIAVKCYIWHYKTEENASKN